MNTSLKNATHLHKKIYTKLDTKTLHKIEKLEISNKKQRILKLDESRVLKESHSISLRDQFKKIFLPLLIDILELRQSIDNFKISSCNNLFSKIGKQSKSVQEILQELENLQEQIQESKRWHDGVIGQITRGIQEAKSSLIQKEKEKEKEKENYTNQGWLKKITNFLRAQ